MEKRSKIEKTFNPLTGEGSILFPLDDDEAFDEGMRELRRELGWDDEKPAKGKEQAGG